MDSNMDSAASFTNVHHPDYYDEHGNYTGLAMWKAIMHDEQDLTVKTLADEVSANTERLLMVEQSIGFDQDTITKMQDPAYHHQWNRSGSGSKAGLVKTIKANLVIKTRLDAEKAMLSHLAQRMGITYEVYTMAGRLDWARKEDDAAWHDEMKARSQADTAASAARMDPSAQGGPDQDAGWKAAYDAFWQEHYIVTDAGRWIRKHDEQATS